MYQLGSYLESYIESVSTLPSELKRNFTLIRELDARSKETQERIERNSKKYLAKVRRQGKTKSAAVDGADVNNTDPDLAAVRKDFATCLEYADEKVGLAMQTYEMVDKHIRKLDQDLRKFEQELIQAQQSEETEERVGQKRKGETLQQRGKKPKKADGKGRGSVVPAASTVPSPVAASSSGSSSSSSSSSATPTNSANRKKGSSVATLASAILPDARVLNVDLDMPIDPNEPTYCYCNRVSFGEMVGCDNPDCKVEWFHFECVGLTAPPKGKWMCAECTAALKDRKKGTHS